MTSASAATSRTPDLADSVSIQLIGGLGNQLFQYGTGLTQSMRLSCPLALDTTYFATTDGRTLEISSFRHEGVTFARRQQPRRWRDKPLVRRVTNHLAPRSIGGAVRLRESSFRYDPRVAAIQPGTWLEGFFQSWRYFDEIAPTLRDQITAINEPSAWFHSTAATLAAMGPWIGVHVRRGDYLQDRYRDTYGPVSWDYLDRSIAMVRRISGHSPIVVFTDDPELVGNELATSGSAGADALLISPPPDSRAIESMVLLSRASHLVISNSSFSWWAAYLGDRDDRLVIAPRPWFVGLDHDTRDLLKPSWITLAAS